MHPTTDTNHQQHQRLRLFLEAETDVGLFFMDADGVVTDWSLGAERVTGFTAEDALGRRGDLIFVQEDVATGAPERELAIATREGQAADERWHLRKDGSRFFGNGRMIALRDAQGALQGFAKIFRDVTAHVRADAALQDALLSFRTLADNISQFAWMADAEGSIFWYNQRWFDYTGTSLEEMKGWGWKATHHPDHLGRVVDRFTRAVRSGVPWEDTFPLRRRDGVYRWFLSRAVPLRNERGAVVRWFGTNTDVDENIRAQQSLAESEQRFRGIFEASGAGRALVDLSTGRFVQVNALFSRMTGYAAGELAALTVPDLIHPHERSSFEQGLAALHARQVAEVTGEYRYVRRDKLVAWGQFTSTLLRAGDQSPSLQVTMLQDVTARKIAERDLMDSRAHMRLAVEAAELGTFFHDQITGQQLWNPRLKHLLGLPEGTRESVDFFLTRVHPDDRAAVRSTLAAAIADAGPAREFKLEFRVVLPDQTERYLLATGRGEFETLADGTEAVRLVGAVRDITEAKRFQQELQNKVAERTVALEEKTDQLEGFCYTVAHDLRSPLRAVAGYADTLSEEVGETLPPESREQIRRIKSAAQRMDALITDLLAYSRVTQIELALEDVSVESSFNRAMQQLRTEIATKGAQIEIAGPLPSVRAERAILDQVVANLLSNALKFVSPGTTPRILIQAFDRDEWARICIQDNGIGIPPAYRDRIFKVFERLREARDFPGTGVGLAIVSRAIARLGGNVGVDSEPGRGSTFWFELRRAPS